MIMYDLVSAPNGQIFRCKMGQTPKGYTLVEFGPLEHRHATTPEVNPRIMRLSVAKPVVDMRKPLDGIYKFRNKHFRWVAKVMLHFKLICKCYDATDLYSIVPYAIDANNVIQSIKEQCMRILMDTGKHPHLLIIGQQTFYNLYNSQDVQMHLSYGYQSTLPDAVRLSRIIGLDIEVSKYVEGMTII